MPTISTFRNDPFMDKDNEFRCPDCVTREHDGDFFCSTLRCPESIPQPKFPSPTSSFPPKKLAVIEDCIEEANEILLTLGVERDSVNLRAIQESFRNLKNYQLSVSIDCGDEPTQLVNGHLVDSGLDFILLQSSVGNIVMIPFERIRQIERLSNERVENPPDQELLNINACLRRALTFHFGEIVPKSPFLLNLFFGLELNLFLESYVGSFIYAKSDSDKMEREGRLEDIRKRGIIMKIDDSIKGIEFDQLCYIEIERNLLAREYMLGNQHPIIM